MNDIHEGTEVKAMTCLHKVFIYFTLKSFIQDVLMHGLKQKPSVQIVRLIKNKNFNDFLFRIYT